MVTNNTQCYLNSFVLKGLFLLKISIDIDVTLHPHFHQFKDSIFFLKQCNVCLINKNTIFHHTPYRQMHVHEQKAANKHQRTCTNHHERDQSCDVCKQIPSNTSLFLLNVRFSDYPHTKEIEGDIYYS